MVGGGLSCAFVHSDNVFWRFFDGGGGGARLTCASSTVVASFPFLMSLMLVEGTVALAV